MDFHQFSYFTPVDVCVGGSNYIFSMKKLNCLLFCLFPLFSLYAQSDSLVGGPSLTDSFRVSGKAFVGKAGMYSSRADGTRTANGEVFSNGAYTAACNKFKFDTWVRVTNLANKKSVIVRINDRTVKKNGAAMMEISRAGVSALGFLRSGYAKVKVEKIILNDSGSIKKYQISEKDKSDSILTDHPNLPDSFRLTGTIVKGMASYYSSNLDGSLTSTGERYRNRLFTAASNNVKLNTWVLVTNLRNKKTVIVRVNDRMHPRMKKKGRVLDLSVAAARQLDFIKAGLAKVKVDILEAIPVGEKPGDSLTTAPDTLSRTDSSGKMAEKRLTVLLQRNDHNAIYMKGIELLQDTKPYYFITAHNKKTVRVVSGETESRGSENGILKDPETTCCVLKRNSIFFRNTGIYRTMVSRWGSSLQARPGELVDPEKYA